MDTCLDDRNRGAKPFGVLVKALILFAGFNLLLNSFPGLRYFVFRQLLPKQDSFPMFVVDHDQQAQHGFGVQNIFDPNVLFESHVISNARKPSSQYRIIFIGDSTVYNSDIYSTVDRQQCNGKTLYAYNLGYFGASATKDLMILQQARKYSPDLVVWPLTDKTLSGEPKTFALANPESLSSLMRDYGLLMSPSPGLTNGRSFFYSSTVIGLQTRLWVDDVILFPSVLSPNKILSIAIEDVKASASKASPWNGDYLFSSLSVAAQIAGNAPLMVINMPRPSVVVSKSDYQHYRQELLNFNAKKNWEYLDLSNLIPDKGFVDSIHRNTEGEALYDNIVIPAILKVACANN